MKSKEDLVREAGYNREYTPDGQMDIETKELLTLEVLIDVRDILQNMYLQYKEMERKHVI